MHAATPMQYYQNYYIGNPSPTNLVGCVLLWEDSQCDINQLVSRAGAHITSYTHILTISLSLSYKLRFTPSFSVIPGKSCSFRKVSRILTITNVGCQSVSIINHHHTSIITHSICPQDLELHTSEMLDNEI